MAGVPDGAAWVITQQTQTSDIGSEGTYVTGVRVTFRTAAGVVASVFLPDTEYTEANVRAAVNARAATADAIAAMQG
ncbi:MAG TPA: hypothetical protein VMD08_03850 [Candidatus Baltobacteraceae bacterium]|nr:hypothetical protein [Candidatus Baltobacteraceae bacterium]